MASVDIKGLDDVVKSLEKLADLSRVEEIAKHAVDAAYPDLEASTQSAISSAVSSAGWGNNPIVVNGTVTKKNEYGVYKVAKIGGLTSEGMRGAQLAGFLEYGVPAHKWGNNIVSVSRSPWRSQAASKAEPSCVKTIEAVIRREMDLE